MPQPPKRVKRRSSNASPARPGPPVERLDGQPRAAHDEHSRISHQATQGVRELEGIFQSIGDAVLVYDRDANVLRANEAAFQLMGATEQPEYFARPAAERYALMPMRDEHGQLVPPDQWPTTRLLRGEQIPGSHPTEVRLRRLDGIDIDVSITGAPMRDAEGAIIGAVIVMRDVTERRQLEGERHHMLAVVTHDLRAPLTSMKMRAIFMRRRMDLGDVPTAHDLDQLDESIHRMEYLVNDLLDAERLDAGHFTLDKRPCDLTDLCRQIAEEQSAATDRPITLDVPSVCLHVTADVDRLAQVLTNLLSNALKYSATDRPVTLRLSESAGCARVEVRDEGPGIPPEALPYLFGRYYRVPGIEVRHGTVSGIGLGLHICRRLVELHGGQIGVVSTPGSGATFWFTLPLDLPQD